MKTCFRKRKTLHPEKNYVALGENQYCVTHPLLSTQRKERFFRLKVVFCVDKRTNRHQHLLFEGKVNRFSNDETELTLN